MASYSERATRLLGLACPLWPASDGHGHPDHFAAGLVAVRAYRKWLDRGQQPGHDLKDWLDAEQELLWGQVPRGADPAE